MTQLKNAKVKFEGDKLLLIDAPEQIKWMKIHSESVRQWHGCPMKIPMQLLNEEMALRNHDQTLEKLNSRGGLGISEIACNIRKTRLNFKNETIEDLHFVMERINRFNADYDEALSKAPTWEIKKKYVNNLGDKEEVRQQLGR